MLFGYGLSSSAPCCSNHFGSLILFSVKSSMNVVVLNLSGRGQERKYMPCKAVGPQSSGGPLSLWLFFLMKCLFPWRFNSRQLCCHKYLTFLSKQSNLLAFCHFLLCVLDVRAMSWSVSSLLTPPRRTYKPRKPQIQQVVVVGVVLFL